MQKSNLLLALSFLLPSFILISCSAPTPTAPPAATNRQTPLARTPRAAIVTPTPAATRAATSTATSVATATSQGVFSRPATIISTFALPGSGSYIAQQYYEEGQSYVKQADFGKAVGAYTQAIQVKPDFVGAYLQRGLAYCFEHETDKALADWKKVGELPAIIPGDASVRAQAANFLAAFSSGC